MFRLRDPSLVAAAGVASAGADRRWSPFSVAQGHCGVALAFGYLDRCFPEEDWDRRAHDHLTAASEAAERTGVSALGLYGGLSGLAFTARYLSYGGRRYGKLVNHLDEALQERLLTRNGEPKHGCPVAFFDLVSGQSGVAAYLLERSSEPRRDGALKGALKGVIDVLGEVQGVPRWHTPSELNVDASLARRHPHGVLNCGLAHGVPGPIAVLSLARLSGVRLQGLKPALRRAADWIAGQRVADEWGVNFPAVVPLDTPAAVSTSRAAWCYGAPGVARSLWLAGRALGDRALSALASEALEAVMRRPLAERRIDSPTFCHGVAGLAQVALRFLHDTPTPTLVQGARALVGQLTSAYEPSSMFGFRSIDPDGGRIDRPGLLDGAAAVALVLLAAACHEEPTWDRFFLLS